MAKIQYQRGHDPLTPCSDAKPSVESIVQYLRAERRVTRADFESRFGRLHISANPPRKGRKRYSFGLECRSYFVFWLKNDGSMLSDVHIYEKHCNA